MSKFTWKILPAAPKEWLEKFPELSEAVGTLLWQRQLSTDQEIESFLSPDYSRDLYSPFLFNHLAKVVERLQQAKAKDELVYIYGDYDADGVCGSAILARTFKKLGFKFAVYLPHREKEGYGLNKLALDFIKDQGAKIVITVDCGISNTEEVAYANSLGLEVIITDHHQLPAELPKALGIIHPQAPGEAYPFKYLAGGGVAYKLACGLIEKSDWSDLEKEKMKKWLLDLVAISAVADMVPLLGENRTLVKYGLIVLSKTQNLGLNELMILANTNTDKITADTISWQLAPRLNAAGRMEHANTALELLVTESLEEATGLALGLNQNNLDRQQQVEEVLQVAKATLQINDNLLIAVGDGWPAGLLGLVSSKITQEFSKPSLVITWDGRQYVGSGRSIKDWNLMTAITAQAELLDKFGGHPQAAGFRLKKELIAFLSPP
ncbi:MAG: single-stranded-DNA-specific exonuclease RecJ [Candidatus Komeilibacteria bacterium]|nr:single-stranded-DNA-specific exonuclease RecJ [Candidatus Komeilibacteria bacterium]